MSQFRALIRQISYRQTPTDLDMWHFVVDPVELAEPEFALAGSLHCVDSVCTHFQTLKDMPTFLPWLACFPVLRLKPFPFITLYTRF
jgi:hypothetical protein